MKRFKAVSLPGYNLFFDRTTGFLARWGSKKSEDPQMSPLGPEIADIEISTVCNGIGKSMDSRVPCSWCYKSNTGTGENMPFDTFAKVFKSFGQSLTQIAFGIGDIDANPDLWQIMEHTRSYEVIPNITTNGMGVDTACAERLAKVCGAVAVSHYTDDICFNAIHELTTAGLKQVNIHKLLAKETLSSCYKLIDQTASDPRLKNLKAIVFLLLKPKGNRNHYHSIESLDEYDKLLAYAKSKNVQVGMDSCSAPMALKLVDEQTAKSVEPCESTLFSIYVNVKGEVFPCSFTEGTPGWETGIDATTIKNFRKSVWQHPKLVEWRNQLLKSTSNCNCGQSGNCRACPVYDITVCKPNLVQIKVG